MENASEPEAPRMSIQTKDLIRYTNHTIHQKKNHAKPIQKFHHNSTHSQPTTKHLDTLPADSEVPRHTPSRQRSASAHSPSHQATRKLSLSSTPSSAALTAHPTPEQPPPHTTALKSQPVRRVLPVDGLCRRGADSWLAEICVVFQKSAV